MANVQYSGVRESRPGRVNDLGTTGKRSRRKLQKGCLNRADRSFAQGLQCQQINSMVALMSLEDSVFVSHSPQGCMGCTIMVPIHCEGFKSKICASGFDTAFHSEKFRKKCGIFLF